MEKRSKKQSFSINIAYTQYPIIRKVAKREFGWHLSCEEFNDNWNILWHDNSITSDKLNRMSHFQKINQFPGIYNISKKNYMSKNLAMLKKVFPKDYSFFPQTWWLPNEFNELKAQFKGKPKTFIVKPENGCQGKGIFLIRKPEDIPTREHYVVQKYILKPYLISSLKFDFRIYVLITGTDPLRIFIYEEGLARFATRKYTQPSKSNIGDNWVHLTNYAINKSNPSFIFNKSEEHDDIGHKRSLTSVFQLLEDEGVDVDRLWTQI